MSFLNPIFLFALLTVVIPLIIYLLNIRKPKRIRFSTLAFFDSLKTTALKRIRIKRWLLLAIRSLAIVMLVLAASRPFLPAGLGWESASQPKISGFLIDNSPSMERVDRNGPYIRQALQVVEELLEMSRPDDRALLDVTNGASLNLPALSPRNISSRLTDIDIQPAGNYTELRINDLINKLEQAREPNKILYVITDGQRTQFRKLAQQETEGRPGINIQFIHIGEAEPMNTGFAGVEVIESNSADQGGVKLRATVKNYGSQTTGNLFLNLIVDNELISQQPFELNPDDNRKFEIDLPDGAAAATSSELVIEGDELTFDDHYYVSLRLPEARSLLVLEGTNENRVYQSYLRPLLDIITEESERIAITTANAESFEVNRLAEYDAFILDGLQSVPDYLGQALTDRVQSGAGLLLLPSSNGNLNSYNRLLSVSGAGGYTNIRGAYGSFEPVDRMARPREGHPVLETIFDKTEEEEIRLNTPEIFYFFAIDEASGSRAVSILDTQTGIPLFRDVSMGNGRIIFSAIGTDAGWSNFPIKPFFAPFYFRLVDYLVQGERVVLQNHTLGEPFRVLLDESIESAEIIKDGVSSLPQLRQTFQGTEVSYDARDWTPGRTTLRANGEPILFSVNMDAMESQLKSLEEAEAEQLLNSVFENVRVIRSGSVGSEFMTNLETASFGREIWHWFIIIAIILLLLESIVSRLYKAETIV